MRDQRSNHWQLTRWDSLHTGHFNCAARLLSLNQRTIAHDTLAARAGSLGMGAHLCHADAPTLAPDGAFSLVGPAAGSAPMSGIEVPALRGRPCTVTLPPRATPIMLGIHPYSGAGLTSIVQRTGFFAFVADLRHVSIVSRLSRNSLSVATIASQRSGAAAASRLAARRA